ncbi:MAG: ABC transporter ATP-binding protein, partial [Proteobacteria bacterium]|nr:ABC transporter ATP-binding protein [Pseudomonadota bacterium]
MTALKLDRVYKDFSGLQVLTGVSMEIAEGERHAVIGPNGAGKSTLFNVITGYHEPTRGKIFFQGRDITGHPAHRIARLGLSRSFQIINNFPKMTVFENVRNAVISKFNRRFNWVSALGRAEDIRIETDRVLESLDMLDSRDIPAAELSYGNQRQLELALALARDPKMIMLDEPTAGLDVEETRGFVELIKRVTEGMTLMVVEHDMDVVFNLADRITVLSYGAVLL